MPTEIYYIDKARILSEREPQDLRRILPLKKFKKKANFVKIREASDKAQMKGFRSSLEFGAPSEEFFSLLLTYENEFKNYSISYLEIARNICFNDIKKAFREYIKHRKNNFLKYSREYFTYNIRSRNSNTTDPSKRFNEETTYHGNRFRLRNYQRYSKISDLPCCHHEFTFFPHEAVKSKTGVANFRHLKELNCEHVFQKLHDQYVRYGKLDRLKIGKWLLGLTGNKKLSYKTWMKCHLRANHFLDAYVFAPYIYIDEDYDEDYDEGYFINEIACFKTYYSKMKKDIRKKKRKSTFEKDTFKRPFTYFIKDISKTPF